MIGLGGLVWVVTYIMAIRVGFREKTHAIPMLAVCLNIMWEFTHSLVFRPPRDIDYYTNLMWLALDLVILYQVFRWGRAMQTIDWLARHFHLVLVITLLLALIGHVTFHLHVVANEIFPDSSGAVSAFIINLVMNVLFVAMYFSRRGGVGISKGIAWGKFLGTGLYIAGNVIVLLTLPEIRYHVQVRPPGAEQWIDAGIIGSSTIHPGFLFFLFGALTTFDLLYLWLVYRPRPVTVT
jgi:hypothetical protein